MLRVHLTVGAIALMIISAADCAPFGTISSNVKSDLLLVNRNNNGIGGGRGNMGLSRRPDVPSGEALDLFYRFGFFSLSVRVVPRDDAGAWLVREPTAAIFDETSVSERITPSAGKFDPSFQVFFCDDIAELNEAYFRDFTAERIEQPHKLFTGSWHKTTKSRYFGLHKESFDGQSSFVLIKLPKKRMSVSASGKGVSPMRLRPDAQRAINSVQVGNPKSVLDFLENYGSHFVQDIVVGDMVYQVIALYRDQFESAKAAAARLLSSSAAASPADFGRLYESHLAPWLVRETGKVEVASGDKEAHSIAKNDLVTNGKFGSYPNIFVLQERPEVTARMEDATEESEAVVGMHFASLRSFVRDPQTRDYYDEVVDSHMALWETNIR